MKNPFLILLLSHIEQSGIQYAIIRDWEKIPDSMSGGDLDLWIDCNKYDQVKRIVQETLTQTGGCLVSFLDNLMVPKYTFFAMEWGLQIDICLTAVQIHCANFLPDDFVQRHTISHNGYNVLSARADAYLAFLKEVINSGYSQKDEYITNFRKVLISSSQDEIRDNLNVYSDVTVKLIKNHVMDEDRHQFKELQKALRKDIFPLINARYLHNQLMKWKRIFQHPGYVIAIMGTDGSGKTAIINALSPWLGEAFHNGVKYKHFRPGWLPDIGVILGKRTKEDCSPEVVETPHAQDPSGFWGSLARLFYYLIDYSLGYFRIVWRQIVAHTKVFVFDRYYYDYYIDARRYRIKLPHWILRVGELLVPRPDVILCLGGVPEKIYVRKPETSLEEVTRQTEELKSFAAKRKNAVWIDTTQPIENSIRDAKAAILDVLSKRFKNIL